MAVKPPLVLILRARVGADAPRLKAEPVDIARQAFEAVFRVPSDDTLDFARLEKRVDQVDLFPASPYPNSLGGHALSLQVLIHPRYEEEVPRPGHDGCGAREEDVGKGIPYRADSEIVPSLSDPKQVDHIQSTAPIALGIVQPCKEGSQSAVPPNGRAFQTTMSGTDRLKGFLYLTQSHQGLGLKQSADAVERLFIDTLRLTCK